METLNQALTKFKTELPATSNEPSQLTIFKRVLTICIKTGSDLNLAVFEYPLPELKTEEGKYWFAKFIGLVSSNYKLDFSDVKSMNYQNVKLIYNTAIEKGFSLPEFRAMTKKFLYKNPYDNFTVANFFNSERICLHSESWKKAESDKNINAPASMEAFVINNDGNEITMYRYYDTTNPIIDNENIRILNKNWDVGGHYSHQYKDYNEINSNGCTNLECHKLMTELKYRLTATMNDNDKLRLELRQLKGIDDEVPFITEILD